MADGLGDTDVLLRLWPCSRGSAPALAPCLQDQGGLIKGGKATSRVLQRSSCMCRACELLAQCGLARVTSCLWFLKCSERNYFPVSSALDCP